MPFDFTALSKEAERDIIDPPRLRNANLGGWATWPAGRPVDFPAEYPTTSHWIKAFRHRLDHLRTTPDLPATCDVLIIGSGITGCSVAYHLIQERPDLKIAVLEARGFCSGATARNGGHCFRPEGWSMTAEVSRIGAQAALAVRRNHIKQRDMIQETIDLHGLRSKVECTFTGGVHIFGSDAERQGHIEDLKLCEELGFDHGSVLMDSAEMGKVIECRNEFGGLFAAESGSFWPRKFCAEIMEVALQQGNINLQTNTCVTALSGSTLASMRWVATTSRGPIHAKTIIHATNAYAGALIPELMGTPNEVSPMREMVIAARPSPAPDSTGTWPVNVLAREGYHYLVQMPQLPSSSQENLVIYGLHGDPHTTDDTTLIENSNEALNDQRRYLAYAFPKKFSVCDDQGRIPLDSIESAWTGIIGMTRDDSVILGPVDSKKGQFTSVGYNGAGMTKCWGSGKVVASMALWELKSVDGKKGEKEKWEAPEWYPSHWLKNLDQL